MQLEFDSIKRDKTLAERSLDFSRAGDVFAGKHFTAPDERQEYAEDRFITVGVLDAARRGAPHHQHEESQ